MTIDKLRDRLAELCGWVKVAIPNQTDRFAPQIWAKGGFSTSYHPFPPNDYNALIAAWPEGWEWAKWGDGTWIAQKCYPVEMRRTPLLLEEVDTGDEYADRLRLTVAVLEAAKPS